MKDFSVRTKLQNILLILKAISLVILGPILTVGHFSLSFVGGLFGCPFPIPLIMCQACPTPCIFGLIRPWLFGGIITTSLLMGRIFCGRLCPFGIIYDVIFKYPVKMDLPKKIGNKLRYVKYGVLILFYYLTFEVANILIESSSIHGLWSLMSMHLEEMRIIVLVATLTTLILSIVLYRPWCRHLCPVGTLLSLFNRFSFLSVKQDPDKCNKCGACSMSCRLGLTLNDFSSSIDCIRCLSCYASCRRGALRLRFKTT